MHCKLDAHLNGPCAGAFAHPRSTLSSTCGKMRLATTPAPQRLLTSPYPPVVSLPRDRHHAMLSVVSPWLERPDGTTTLWACPASTARRMSSSEQSGPQIGLCQVSRNKRCRSEGSHWAVMMRRFCLRGPGRDGARRG